MRAADALAAAVGLLRAAGVETAPGDARRLLAHAMDLPADRLTLHLDRPLDPEAAARFAASVAARETRQPVSQILGQRAFYGRLFRVTPAVLDPRPETETLVEQSLAGRFSQVLDMGTGSGAILCTLLAERPAAHGLGIDLSSAALEVARGNARDLGLMPRARFMLSDWFARVTGKFDLIVANPPYIAEAEMEHLAPEVRLWEPALALTPGGDGLGAYRAIAAGLPRHLAPGGRVLLEIGPTQTEAVAGCLKAAGLLRIRVHPDLDRRDRVLAAEAP